MKKWVSAVIAGLLSTSLTISLVARGDAQSALRFGASLPQTGPYAGPGQNQLRGYRLCVKHVNEKGGLLGRRIELITEDDQSKPPAGA